MSKSVIHTKEEATKTVLEFLNPDIAMQSVGDEYAIVPEHTIETKNGWVFHVVSRRFLETGDSNYRLLGQRPLIVERVDGTIRGCGDQWDSLTTVLRKYELQKSPSFFNEIRVFINSLLDFLFRRSRGFPDP